MPCGRRSFRSPHNTNVNDWFLTESEKKDKYAYLNLLSANGVSFPPNTCDERRDGVKKRINPPIDIKDKQNNIIINSRSEQEIELINKLCRLCKLFIEMDQIEKLDPDILEWYKLHLIEDEERIIEEINMSTKQLKELELVQKQLKSIKKQIVTEDKDV